MDRTFVAVLLLLVSSWISSIPRNLDLQATVWAEPDPTQARPLDHRPDEADLARLQSVEGKPKTVIIQLLGHPSHVECRPDGEEVWDYPWCASCCVWIRNGVCTGTFYTAGY
jgi:hypothetical protein